MLHFRQAEVEFNLRNFSNSDISLKSKRFFPDLHASLTSVNL